MLLPFPVALNQCYGGEHDEEKAHNLGDPKPLEHETIRPESLNPESPKGIQHEIDEKYIAPDYPPFPSDPQQEEKDGEVPEGFIEECWVEVGLLHVLNGSMGLIDENPPGQIRRPSEGLLVKEVAPAPDGLAQDEARGTDVGKEPEG